MPPSLFCFGLGYSAEVLARRCLAKGWTVAGTARDSARLADLAALGIRAMVFDRDHPLPVDALHGVTHLLTSVPPDGQGDAVLDGCRARILAAGTGLQWIGYLSTTGVYGDCQGGWVDERSPLRPSSDRARRRVAAETAWLALGLPVHVFRLAGIYGPGRNVLEDIRGGTAQRIVKPGQLFSRIHVEDITTVLEASIARPRSGAIYNVCDEEAAMPQTVVAHGCALLGVAPPPELPFAQAALSPMAQTFWADNKRVRNDLIKDELGVRFAFPSYREGLAECCKSGS